MGSKEPLHLYINERPPPKVETADILASPPSIEIPVELVMAEEKMTRIWEPERAERFRPILRKAVQDLLVGGDVTPALIYLRHFNQELDQDITVQKRRSFWSWLAEVFATVFLKVATEVTTFFLGPRP